MRTWPTSSPASTQLQIRTGVICVGQSNDLLKVALLNYISGSSVSKIMEV
jgi:hypothetical protein